MGPLLIKPAGMMLFYTGADTSVIAWSRAVRVVALRAARTYLRRSFASGGTATGALLHRALRPLDTKVRTPDLGEIRVSRF